MDLHTIDELFLLQAVENKLFSPEPYAERRLKQAKLVVHLNLACFCLTKPQLNKYRKFISKKKKNRKLF